jgi:hypothetical protein
VRVYEVGHAADSIFSKASADILPPVWRMIGRRHLCGTEPRDFHWWKVLRGTPSASAASKTNSQSSDVAMTTIHTDDLSASQEQFVRGRLISTPLQFVMATDNIAKNNP